MASGRRLVHSSAVAPVIAFVIADTVCVAVVTLVARPYRLATPDPTLDIGVIASRSIEILSALSGFAVTAIVLLVTLGHAAAEARGESFTALLAMFVTAYIGYIATAFMYAFLSSSKAEGARLDAHVAQYAIATVFFYITIFIGWFGFRPLFLTFDLPAMVDLVSWLLVMTLLGGYALVASTLYRIGYVSLRLLFLQPLTTIVTMGAYAVVAANQPALRSSGAILDLTLLSFVIGAVAYVSFHALPLLVERDRQDRLTRYVPIVVVAFAQTALVLLSSLLIAVLGVA